MSTTVTVNEQLAEPQLFTAEQLTVLAPTAKVLPDAGVQVTVGDVPVVVGLPYVTTAEHWPAAAFCVTLAGQVMVGGVHETWTTNVPLVVRLPLPWQSAPRTPVRVKVWVPGGVAKVVVIVKIRDLQTHYQD